MDKHSFSNLCTRIIHQKWNLGAWSLWNHCTRCVFDGAAPTSGGTGFTPGGEPPLVPVPHPGVSIRD